jgi:uncharacterized membrane protein
MQRSQAESVNQTETQSEMQKPEPLPDYPLTNEEKNFVIWSHLLGLPTLGIYPYLIYYKHSGKTPFIAFHALQSVLFTAPLVFSMAFATRFIAPLNIIYFLLSSLMWVFLALMSAAAANQGRWFNLPLFGATARKLLKLPRT